MSIENNDIQIKLYIRIINLLYNYYNYYFLILKNLIKVNLYLFYNKKF